RAAGGRDLPTVRHRCDEGLEGAQSTKCHRSIARFCDGSDHVSADAIISEASPVEPGLFAMLECRPSVTYCGDPGGAELCAWYWRWPSRGACGRRTRRPKRRICRTCQAWDLTHTRCTYARSFRRPTRPRT